MMMITHGVSSGGVPPEPVDLSGGSSVELDETDPTTGAGSDRELVLLLLSGTCSACRVVVLLLPAKSDLSSVPIGSSGLKFQPNSLK